MGVIEVNIVVSWICVFCFSIICANCLKLLYVSFFYESNPKKSRRATRTSHHHAMPEATREHSYQATINSNYVSGAVAMKEDIRYNSYEQYRRNHKIAR